MSSIDFTTSSSRNGRHGDSLLSTHGYSRHQQQQHMSQIRQVGGETKIVSPPPPPPPLTSRVKSGGSMSSVSPQKKKAGKINLRKMMKGFRQELDSDEDEANSVMEKSIATTGHDHNQFLAYNFSQARQDGGADELQTQTVEQQMQGQDESESELSFSDLRPPMSMPEDDAELRQGEYSDEVSSEYLSSDDDCCPPPPSRPLRKPSMNLMRTVDLDDLSELDLGYEPAEPTQHRKSVFELDLGYEPAEPSRNNTVAEINQRLQLVQEPEEERILSSKIQHQHMLLEPQDTEPEEGNHSGSEAEDETAKSSRRSSATKRRSYEKGKDLSQMIHLTNAKSSVSAGKEVSMRSARSQSTRKSRGISTRSGRTTLNCSRSTRRQGKDRAGEDTEISRKYSRRVRSSSRTRRSKAISNDHDNGFVQTEHTPGSTSTAEKSSRRRRSKSKTSSRTKSSKATSARRLNNSTSRTLGATKGRKNDDGTKNKLSQSFSALEHSNRRRRSSSKHRKSTRTGSGEPTVENGTSSPTKQTEQRNNGRRLSDGLKHSTDELEASTNEMQVRSEHSVNHHRRHRARRSTGKSSRRASEESHSSLKMEHSSQDIFLHDKYVESANDLPQERHRRRRRSANEEETTPRSSARRSHSRDRLKSSRRRSSKNNNSASLLLASIDREDKQDDDAGNHASAVEPLQLVVDKSRGGLRCEKTHFADVEWSRTSISMSLSNHPFSATSKAKARKGKDKEQRSTPSSSGDNKSTRSGAMKKIKSPLAFKGKAKKQLGSSLLHESCVF